VQQAKAKVSRPLYGVVIRVAGRGTNEDRAWGIARRLSGALSVLNNPEGNELFPLDNEDYPYDEHEIDVLLRRSRRCGMILNSDELTTLVHLPSASLQAPKLRRQSRMTRPAPSLVLDHPLLIGVNEHAGEERYVTLSDAQRAQHMHIIGASGTGKSTLLLSLITQDLCNGNGLAVLDPHGDLIDQVLERVPEKPHRRRHPL